MNPKDYLLNVIDNPLDADGNFTVPVATGDFILVKSSANWFDRMISFGQGARFSGENKLFASYIHTALIIDPTGNLIESDSKGVRQTKITDYKGITVTLIKLGLSDEDQREIYTYANNTLNEGYGWVTDMSIGLSLLTGLKLSFGFEGQEICSGFVAKALEHGGKTFTRDASHMCPADLAKLFMS